MKTNKYPTKYIILMFVCSIIISFSKSLLIIFLLLSSYLYTSVDVNIDISQYNKYIGSTAKEEYRSKWGMDESIFPDTINNLNVLDYKMVYYNPWDAQYLSYIVVQYDKNDYQKEKERLTSYPSTNYKGYYGVTGFTKYTLLAMHADSYNGFVYAITDDVDTIIYVEMIFCNYFMDLDYNNYINNDYLPDGFDATINNNYSKEQMSRR